MGIQKHTKLNLLLRHWPDGKINSSTWLNSEGYGANFIQKYKNNYWIEAIGAGAFKKAGDKVSWAAAVECLQKQLKSEIYVGGKTALEIAGLAQYLKIKETNVVLLSNKKGSMPVWMKKYDWNTTLDLKVKKLFDSKLIFAEKSDGFKVVNLDKATIIVSCAERAYLEYLDEIPQVSSYTEALEIMENMISIRPIIAQRLLENCKSLKVKRLFLHLAEKVNHSWFKKINIEKIDLGSGKRVIFKNGLLDKKYNITVPKVESHEEL